MQKRVTERGAIIVFVAILLPVLLGCAALVVDLGLGWVMRQRLQTAADAAALAGAAELPTRPASAAGAAQTYAAYNGVSLLSGGCASDGSATLLVNQAGSLPNSWRVTVGQLRRQVFSRIWGDRATCIEASATAQRTSELSDVMLSLDLTGSMELSGTSDLANLRSAVAAFVNQVNPSTSDPNSPKVGMARWAGIMCGWNRSSSTDQYIDLGPGVSEYVVFPSTGKCADDKTVLTPLTQDKELLLKLADNSGATACPAGMAQYACPLTSWRYSAPVVNGPAFAPLGLAYGGVASPLNPAPMYTGTKLPNAISVVSDPAAGVNYWSSASGGRNGASASSNARKFLVMITDGNNELWPDQGMPADPAIGVAAWDNEVVSRADMLKRGADGVAGTSDDVEIYVVGFYCTPYLAGQWCTSSLASTPIPHTCPGPRWPPAGTPPSSIDTLLQRVSSSTPGTCDHYYPIRKTESLAPLFTTIAGKIARVRLVQ